MSDNRIPTSVRAAVLNSYGEELELAELPVPELEPGALLVRMEAATVCGSDTHFWTGHFADTFDIRLPAVPGHEGIGRIVGMGAGADCDTIGTTLRVGDRVAWAHMPCGHCHTCGVLREPELCPDMRIGYFASCAEPPYITGTFADYAYVMPGAQRVRVPDALDSALASAASCAMRTVIHSLDRLGSIGTSDTVVVQGSGAVGLFATALAAAHNPRRLIVIGDPADRLELAGRWGADTTISVADHPSTDERLALVRDELGSDGASIVMDMSGGPGVFTEGVEMTARGGRYLVVGTIGGPAQPVLPQRIATRGIRIIGSFSGLIDSYHKAFQFMARHGDRYDWHQLLGNTYDLTKATDALRAVRSGAEIKPVITMEA